MPTKEELEERIQRFIKSKRVDRTIDELMDKAVKRKAHGGKTIQVPIETIEHLYAEKGSRA